MSVTLLLYLYINTTNNTWLQYLKHNVLIRTFLSKLELSVHRWTEHLLYRQVSTDMREILQCFIGNNNAG